VHCFGDVLWYNPALSNKMYRSKVWTNAFVQNRNRDRNRPPTHPSRTFRIERSLTLLSCREMFSDNGDTDSSETRAYSSKAGASARIMSYYSSRNTSPSPRTRDPPTHPCGIAKITALDPKSCGPPPLPKLLSCEKGFVSQIGEFRVANVGRCSNCSYEVP